MYIPEEGVHVREVTQVQNQDFFSCVQQKVAMYISHIPLTLPQHCMYTTLSILQYSKNWKTQHFGKMDVSILR
jgi:hypothetical protein